MSLPSNLVLQMVLDQGTCLNPLVPPQALAYIIAMYSYGDMDGFSLILSKS